MLRCRKGWGGKPRGPTACNGHAGQQGEDGDCWLRLPSQTEMLCEPGYTGEDLNGENLGILTR